MKKQIVFIEYFPMIHTFKIAKGLKDTGNYETVLISFKKVDRKFFGAGYNEIINFQISQRPSFKNILSLIQKVFSKDRRIFLKKIKNLKPYIVQIAGLDLFSLLTNFLIDKKTPRVYYAYDIIAYYGKKDVLNWNIRRYSLNNFPMLTKRLEKYYFQNFDGILHKGPENELSFLKYSVNAPHLTILPGCLKDWTHPPRKKSMKEIHIVHAGAPLDSSYYKDPYKNIIKIITSQKIHLHTYGKSSLYDSQYLNEEKNNPYYHYHDRTDPIRLNKELSSYHYGILPDFFNDLIDPLWPQTSTGHKMYNCLEAGLPIIMTKDLKAMADVVKKYEIGICIDYEDLEELKKILKSLNYRKLQDKVKVVQKRLSVGKITKDLEVFYEKVAERKTKSMR